jgi:hypothetical protein
MVVAEADGRPIEGRKLGLSRKTTINLHRNLCRNREEVEDDGILFEDKMFVT